MESSVKPLTPHFLMTGNEGITITVLLTFITYKFIILLNFMALKSIAYLLTDIYLYILYGHRSFH